MMRYLAAFTALCISSGVAHTYAQESQEPGIGAETIKVGVIGPFSGPAGEYSKVQIGAISYLRHVNEAGGVHGRTFEIIVEDDGCEETKGIAAARKLIFQDEVFALASAYACSGPALAAKPTIVKEGVPWMIGGAASSALTNPVAENVFQPTATTADVGHAMVRFALSSPDINRIALISHSDEWATGYYEGAVAELREQGGEPLLDLTMERQSTNPTPQILKIREASPDAIIAILYPAEMSIFLRDARKFGISIPIITGYGVTLEDQLARTGDASALANFYAAYLLSRPFDSPEMDQWRNMVQKYYPEEVVNPQNMTGLGGVILFVEALEAAGPHPTREKLINALEDIHDFDTGVMAGRYTFTPDDHAGQKELSFVRLVDGAPSVFTVMESNE